MPPEAARGRPPAVAERREETRRAAPAGDPLAIEMLRLQRSAGNQAVGRMLARKTLAPRETGLRDDAATHRFTHKAVAFLERNRSLELLHYANYLGAAVNVELNALGVIDVHVSVGKGALGAAAEFDADGWAMSINPDEFSHRPGVERMGDLDRDESALIAMTVYHEARHAEQAFRVARLLATEHQPAPPGMNEDAAAAAAKLPLDRTTATAREIEEARAWRTNTVGEDAVYREAVTWWQGEALKAARLARDVDETGAPALRERLDRLIRGWSKPGAAADFVHSHLPSAQQRKAAAIVADITRIDAELALATAALDALGEQAKAAEFSPLAAALADLYRAVSAAYHHQPVEQDAYDAGGAAFAAFSAEPAGPPQN
jgi:hypothetical protein